MLVIPAQAQQKVKTKIKGVVIDAKTKEPLPFVNIAFKGANIGTTTDFDGKFVLETIWATKTVMASFVGYKTAYKKVELGKVQTINFNLKNDAIEMETFTVKASRKRYKNKNNPAVDLIKLVLDNRDKNRTKAFDYLEVDKHEKVEFDLNNFSEKFKDKKYMKSFKFVFDNYVDTSEVNGKPYIPMLLRETASKVYHRKKPFTKKEYQIGVRQTEYNQVNNDGFSSVMDKLYQDIDIYENEIPLLNKNFTSPISYLSTTIYKYFIIDTLDVNGHSCINLAFSPRIKGDFGFMGNLFILNDSSTYAVVKAKMKVPQQINLNFIEDLEIDQEFMLVNDTMWMLSKDQLIIDYNIAEKGMGIFGKKLTSYRDYVFNEQRSDSIYDRAGNVIKAEEEIDNKSEEFWTEARHDTLTEDEKGVYEMVDSIQNVRVFKIFTTVMSIATSGWIGSKYFEIGPISTLVSFNDIEGIRTRFGGRTTTNLNKHLQYEGYLAYGFTDKEFKYLTKLTYYFNNKFRENPQHRVSLSRSSETVFPGQGLRYINDDNFLLSFKSGKTNKMLLYDIYEASYINELPGGYSYEFIYQNKRQSPLGILNFNSGDINSPVYTGTFTTDNLTLNLRYAPNEEFYLDKNFRRQLTNEFPIFKLGHTQGVKGFINGDYEFGRTTASIFKRFYITLLGFTDVELSAGKVWGSVPYPLLHIANANQSFSLQKSSFNTMNFMEFVGDEHVTLMAYHYFKGAIFNKIPLFNKLKLREVIGVKATYGRLSDLNDPNKNSDLFHLPTDENGKQTTFSLEARPYIEASVGVSNIAKLIRIDLIQRLTYLDDAYSLGGGLGGVPGLRISGIATFDF